MGKILQAIVGFVVLALVVVVIVLFLQVQALEKNQKVVAAEADSLYAWVYRAVPSFAPRWQMIWQNFDALRALHHLEALPPGGTVPPSAPTCVPPSPCPPQ